MLPIYNTCPCYCIFHLTNLSCSVSASRLCLMSWFHPYFLYIVHCTCPQTVIYVIVSSKLHLCEFKCNIFFAGVFFCRMQSFQHFHYQRHCLLPSWKRTLWWMFIEEEPGVATAIWCLATTPTPLLSKWSMPISMPSHVEILLAYAGLRDLWPTTGVLETI